MTKINTEEIIKDLIETFLSAGEVSINLRKDGNGHNGNSCNNSK